jgi:hypothetical protein
MPYHPVMLLLIRGHSKLPMISLRMVMFVHPTHLSAAAFAATRATPRRILEQSCNLAGVRNDILDPLSLQVCVLVWYSPHNIGHRYWNSSSLYIQTLLQTHTHVFPGTRKVTELESCRLLHQITNNWLLPRPTSLPKVAPRSCPIHTHASKQGVKMKDPQLFDQSRYCGRR